MEGQFVFMRVIIVPLGMDLCIEHNLCQQPAPAFSRGSLDSTVIQTSVLHTDSVYFAEPAAVIDIILVHNAKPACKMRLTHCSQQLQDEYHILSTLTKDEIDIMLISVVHTREKNENHIATSLKDEIDTLFTTS